MYPAELYAWARTQVSEQLLLIVTDGCPGLAGCGRSYSVQRKRLPCYWRHCIAVRFAYEWHDDSGHWYRSYGNENWEFNDDGLTAEAARMKNYVKRA